MIFVFERKACRLLTFIFIACSILLRCLTYVQQEVKDTVYDL